MSQAPSIVFGTFTIAAGEEANKYLEILKNHNVKALDTAYIYPDSEATLGKHQAPKSFTIDTKAPGFQEGCLSKQSVLDGMKTSLERLGTDSVDIYYLHSPDTATPIEETLSAISQLYKEGKFKRFGVSNFKAEEVQKIYDIQSANNSVLPSVFQGNYNAVSRHIETDLFPLLHKLKISFYAYSPIAGGFLVKTAEQVRAKEGRFSHAGVGEMYSTMYGKESLFNALDKWEQIAQDANISKASLAYRWIAYHSELKATNGDAIIVGATKTSQLEETLTAVEAGPLEKEIAERVSAIWETVKHEAPRDNYHR